MDESDTNKVAKIMILNKGKVLLLKSVHLGKFQLPGGHLKLNETFSQGLQREIKEETGLILSWFKPVFSKPNFVLYKGGVYASPIRLSDEHTDHVWAKIEDAHKYPLCNITKRDIAGLQKYWKNVLARKENQKKMIDFTEE